MHKSAQDQQDWIRHTGSHATRPLLNVSVRPKLHSFDGRLAELKDEKAKLLQLVEHLKRGPAHRQAQDRIAIINQDIKRLNREASKTHQLALMGRAIVMFLGKEREAQLTRIVAALDIAASGESSERVLEALSPIDPGMPDVPAIFAEIEKLSLLSMHS